MEEAALSSRLTTQEKLLISQAVYKLGAVNWEKISSLLENHPVIDGRPKEWFDATTVEAYYVGLMTEIGQNVYVLFPFDARSLKGKGNEGRSIS
jgi:bromodomain-containing protein 8